jgi:hypothetical protein
MTSFAMIAGMIPMAIGLGEGGSQTAPLGRAVIGGLIGATLATLGILPAVFAMLQRETTRKSASLHPADRIAHASPVAAPSGAGNGQPSPPQPTPVAVTHEESQS